MVVAFIFDMDGVIADTERVYIETFNNILAKYNVRLETEDYFRRFPGTGTRYIMSTLFKEHAFEPREGLDYWLKKWKEEYQGYVIEGKIKPVKGFLDFNKKVNALKVQKIIATGAHRANAFLVLKSFGIEKEFDILGSEDVQKRKPHPEIFLKAAARLKKDPKECIVFEDAVLGIRAAKSANMVCVALATGAPKAILLKENPDFMYDDFTEINIEDILGT